MDSKFLSYRGRPLVRCGDEIFYGKSSELQIVFMHIDSKSEDNIPDKVSVGLINSMAAFKGHFFKPLKYSVKSSLFEALDLASAWLDRMEISKNS